MKEPLEPMRRILVIALLFGFYVNNNNYTFLNVTGTNFSNTQYIKKPLSYRVGYTLINNVELENVTRTVSYCPVSWPHKHFKIYRKIMHRLTVRERSRFWLQLQNAIVKLDLQSAAVVRCDFYHPQLQSILEINRAQGS